MTRNDNAQKTAKEFLSRYLAGDYAWCNDNPLFCAYKGKRWHVPGATTDFLFLKQDFDRMIGYDITAKFEDCSDFEVIKIAKAEGAHHDAR